ncbi:hypothetical protein PACTADRAFT_49367 [Pachysolen tannophilus NRRL Y-2460]|uniref:Uncharacterized protein n=1 Tax=Pachysolen tannophilus NRRL Y-2460 TaxID=669874 RepID=A0A1E4TW23_PACTA|nr:hypothetical protein PACTADRAFT_49367 [Pachysolen tannophilus NRRL Y-2460]
MTEFMTAKYIDVSSKMEQINERIRLAKQETEILNQQIIKVNTRLNDRNLIETASNIMSLPPDYNANSKNSTLKLYKTLTGHSEKIANIRWNKDSRHLLSASQDGYMIIWDTLSGLKTNAIELDSEWVLTCAYSPNGQLVASGGLKNNCTVYNVVVNKLLFHPQRANNYISSSGSGVNGVESYPMSKINVNRSQYAAVFKGHKCYISDCEFINNNQILTASGDLTCALWDIARGSRVREFTQHLGDVLSLAVQPATSNPLFVSGSADGIARVWDLRKPTPVQWYHVSKSDITTMKFFPESYSFATGSDDDMIRFYDLKADRELSEYTLPRTLQQLHRSKRQSHYPNINRTSGAGGDGASSLRAPGNTGHFGTDSSSSTNSSIYSSIDSLGVISIDFSSSGRLMYACYADLSCVVWDTLKAEVLGQIEGHSGRINQVSVSPDGKSVCTASWDDTIKIWIP